jgi:hypothetical protein
MNPIVEELMSHIGRSKKIVSILIENKANPDVIYFCFDDGKRKKIATNPKDHAQFMKWWIQASAYFKIKMQKMQNADSKLLDEMVKLYEKMIGEGNAPIEAKFKKKHPEMSDDEISRLRYKAQGAIAKKKG